MKDEKTLYVANGLGDDLTVVDVTTRKALNVPMVAFRGASLSMNTHVFLTAAPV